ncbi:hypothetical protein JB92DRAFT_2847387 [Gautieria morchelliformis]|nr:hypothetical protein JB92DRAFT_2847387 [Gautieria morchelliformis]
MWRAKLFLWNNDGSFLQERRIEQASFSGKDHPHPNHSRSSIYTRCNGIWMARRCKD